MNNLLKDLGINEENIRLRAHDPEELAHYSMNIWWSIPH